MGKSTGKRETINPPKLPLFKVVSKSLLQQPRYKPLFMNIGDPYGLKLPINKTRINFFHPLTLYIHFGVFFGNSVLENADHAYSCPFLEINCSRKFYETSLMQKRSDGPTYNVIDVWKKNITGAGVVVAVVDEGFDPQHPEIYDNYLHVSHYQ